MTTTKVTLSLFAFSQNMAEVSSHRRWVYDSCYSGRKGLKETFVIGVEQFIQTTRQYKYYALEGGIRCPCVKCEGTHILKDEEVKVHLYKKGFMPDYWIWTFHGEEVPFVYSGEHEIHFPSQSTMDHTSKMNHIMYMQEMLNNTLGQHDSFEEADDSHLEESPNDFTQ